MADDPQAFAEPPDAVALNRARAGDAEAYGILRRRHAPAVRRLAWVLVPPGDIDEVVAETFAQVHEVILRGGGPDDAFRLYVLNATRLVSNEWLHVHSDPAEPYADAAAGSPGAQLIAREFHSLPERWVAVLWHTEIEEASTADAGEILGLTPEATAVVQRQALDSLRQACLQAHISGVTRPECQWVAVQLAAFVRDVASDHDRAIAAGHLAACEECSQFCSDLADIRNTLRAVVAPIYLGDAAASYLLAAREAAARATAAGEEKQRRATAVSAVRPRLGRLLQAPSLGRLLHAPSQRRWLAAGTATLLAAALVLGVSLAAHGTSTRTVRLQVAPPPAAAQTTQSAQPPATTPRNGRPAGSGATGPARPGAAPSASLVQLSATVTVQNFDPLAGVAEIEFDVTDTGSAATGEVDVKLTWAPLESTPDGAWTCQSTRGGAACEHSPISAGGQAQETVLLGAANRTSCGQPVQLSAVSGNAQASAQSSPITGC